MKKYTLTLSLFLIFLARAADRIKMYAVYTPSHEKLVNEWFLPSIQDDFELILHRYEQECSTGSFWASGWQKTIIRKVELWIKAAEENEGKIFICSDVDIQFFQSIEEYIRNALIDCDFVVQQDNPKGELCSGFFACIGSKRLVKLFKGMRELMLSKSTVCDQQALNNLLRISNTYGIKWRRLPVQFYGGGTLTGTVWQPGLQLPIPEGILLHHANYAVGINHKIAQLKHVKDNVIRVADL